MTEIQIKAEAYVRQQLPELAGFDSGRPQGSGYIDYPQIHLQHWLRVLEKADPGEYMINGIGQVFYYDGSNDDKPGFKVRCYKTLTFNLTTGQPATEADYQSLCNILGI